MKARNYFVYVISCNDGSFYTGYTTCLEKRMQLHKKGRGARYTQVHGVNELVHQETFVTRREAIQRERQIKKLSHEEKKLLHDKHHASNTRKTSSVQTSPDA
ncbi:GIY-YIG nuclease family protein [Candidatus Bathyarchaeota archaeon]|nr:GIY-YIG nuclease family protein [Candidatus Bathyarchaeota archaeon]